MKSNHQKEADFVLSLCPSVSTKSGERYFIADWEITEPKERKGQHLVVTRYDSRPIMKMKLLEPQENKAPNKLMERELYPSQSGEFYLNNRKLSITEEGKGKLTMTGLFDHPLKMQKVKITGEK